MNNQVIKSGNSTIISGSTLKEHNSRHEFFNFFKDTPIPNEQLFNNLGLFLRRQNLSRILFMNELYKKIVNLHGVVIEFGVHWGQNLSLLHSFRGMYEPFNYNRKILGFDTFEGFPSVHENDGKHSIIEKGAYAVSDRYEDYLTKILDFHQSESPISHIKKYELVKGDATKTIVQYLKDNPETIIAFAYFDFDIYEPTRACLQAILPHLTKGAVIGFDELNFHDFPGETLAFKEILGINNFRIQRDVNTPSASYIIFE
jgi:hypothetical protein